MELKFNTALQSKALDLKAFSLVAHDNAVNAKTDLDAYFAGIVRQAGLGKGALVTHIHAKANHGNLSDKIVTSRVVNAFASFQMQPALRIQLGRANGKLGDYYATILLSDVIDAVTSSDEKYFA